MPDPRLSYLERLAHDLRGPLSPLQTAAYLLRRDDLDLERRRELAGIIDRQTARLGGMVQEVGDWIRAGQSRLVSHRELSELVVLVDLAAASPPPPHVQAGALDLRLDASLDGVVVVGDAQRLAQMLATLVAYARSRAGGTGVRVDGERQGDRVHLRIREQGPALPPVELESLFEAPQAAPFDEGLGLRLLIAQAIAQAHGGHLEARALGEGGTEYLVDLPVAEQAAS